MRLLSGNCLDPQQRREEISTAFHARFGTAPQLAVRAPGRVDLMGSHTDYNEGSVLTLPIDRETWIFAAPRADAQVEVTSLNLGSTCAFSLLPTNSDRQHGWAQYIEGVAVMLGRAGYKLHGFNAVVHGTVPISSGLSSSASLESAVATLFEQLGGFSIPAVEKARLCQQAENQWVGVNCGILDQYSSILGERDKALLLDCRTLTHQYAEFPKTLRVVICNTCAPRNLSGSEYGDRREQCEQAAAYFARLDNAVTALRDVPITLFRKHQTALPEQSALRARFIIEENQRVLELAEVLRRDDRHAIDRLTAASFAGARDLFEISIPAMQAMYDAMRAAPGHVGSRQAGAGFGGCMVAFVAENQIEAFRSHVHDAYHTATGIEPEVYPVDSAAGAGVLR